MAGKQLLGACESNRTSTDEDAMPELPVCCWRSRIGGAQGLSSHDKGTPRMCKCLHTDPTEATGVPFCEQSSTYIEALSQSRGCLPHRLPSNSSSKGK